MNPRPPSVRSARAQTLLRVAAVALLFAGLPAPVQFAELAKRYFRPDLDALLLQHPVQARLTNVLGEVYRR